MDRFKIFCEMFANFPTLQKDLSLLDKPAANGEYPFLSRMRNEHRANYTQALRLREEHHRLDQPICHHQDGHWVHQANAATDHRKALHEVLAAHKSDQSTDDELQRPQSWKLTRSERGSTAGSASEATVHRGLSPKSAGGDRRGKSERNATSEKAVILRVPAERERSATWISLTNWM
jgi:hypothetical protein